MKEEDKGHFESDKILNNGTFYGFIAAMFILMGLALFLITLL